MSAFILHAPYLLLRIANLFRRPERPPLPSEEPSPVQPYVDPGPAPQIPEMTLEVAIDATIARGLTVPVPDHDGSRWDLQGLVVRQKSGRLRYCSFESTGESMVKLRMVDDRPLHVGETAELLFRQRSAENCGSPGTLRHDF